MKNGTIIALLAAGFLGHVYYLNCAAEDAYITFRFARNVCDGNGFAWNTTEPPVEGYTNFLWVLLSAAVMRVGWDVALTMQLAGLVFACATIAYSFVFARRVFGWTVGQALLPGLFMVISGPFATWAGSAMETSAFTFFVFAGCTHVCLGAERRFHLVLGAVSMLCASLLRPEGVFCTVMLVGLFLVWDLRSLGRRMQQLVVPGLCYLLPALIYFYWRYNYFGFLLPNTFYAKVGGGASQYTRGAKYIIFYGMFFGTPYLPLLLLFAWRDRGRRWWEFVRSAGSGAGDQAKFGAALCCVFVAAYACYIAMVGGDYMAMFRFVVPLIPPLSVLLAIPVVALATAAPPSRVALYIAILVAVVGTLVHSTSFEEQLFRRPSMQHGNWRGVQAERWHVSRLQTIGRFFKGYSRESSEVVATRAIGALSFVSEMNVQDILGLVDPVIAHAEAESLGSGWPGHEKMNLAYSFSRYPTYFMFQRRFLDDPESLQHAEDLVEFLREKARPFQEFRNFLKTHGRLVEHFYDLVDVHLYDEGNDEEGVFVFLELKPQFRQLTVPRSSNLETAESSLGIWAVPEEFESKRNRAQAANSEVDG